MKKLYTLMMAAGVSALACSAAQPMQKVTGHCNFSVAKTANAIQKEFIPVSTTVKNDVGSRAVSAPEDLSTCNFTMTYEIVETDRTSGETQYYPFSNELTFKKIESDIEGLDKYEMSGWFTGVYNEEYMTILPLEVYYSSEDGTLEIPTGNPISEGLLTNGNIATGLTWNLRDDGYVWTGVPFVFKYNGEGFDWITEISVTDQNNQPMDFVSEGLFVASVTEDNKLETFFFQATNFALRVAQGTMTFTADMQNTETGKTESTTLTSSIFASVSANTVSIDNFGAPIFDWVVPFTVDTNAKTFTCQDVQVGTTNSGAPIFLSQAEKLFNKYESEGAYKIVAPYTVEGGKTIVEIGEWNTYYYNAAIKEDQNNLVPLYNTTIVLNFDVDAIMAGVGNIVADADENAPVEYFNLQGVRVQNPENGFYIRRQGKNVTKVIL